MREIECRGLVINKLVSGEEWVSSDEEYHEIYVNKVEKTAYINGHEVVYDSISEYTGLKDRNGVKIFENDIILISNKSYKKKAIVEWSVRSAKWVLVCDDLSVFELATWIEALYEVIGNIYETPELLEE